MGRKVGWGLSLLMLLGTGVAGLSGGLRELDGARTALQRSVTLGVLVYGILGLAAGVTLAVRHRASVPLAALWGIVVTYVASTAALAYAGEDATIVGAVASGVATALIAVGVVWSARVSSRRTARVPAKRAGAEPRQVARALTVVALLSGAAAGVEGCYAFYQNAPGVMDPGVQTKRVLAKREPDRLIAEDLTVCWVIPDVFAGIKPGDAWRCNWQVVPSGM